MKKDRQDRYRIAGFEGNNLTARNKFTDEERQAFYKSILHLDPEAKYALVDKDADTLSYTASLTTGTKV